MTPIPPPGNRHIAASRLNWFNDTASEPLSPLILGCDLQSPGLQIHPPPTQHAGQAWPENGSEKVLFLGSAEGRGMGVGEGVHGQFLGEGD